MATPGSLITAVADYVATTGRHCAGVQAFARWSRRVPTLALFRSLPDLVRACREGPPAEQDRLLAAMLAVAVTEPLAQLAVVAWLSCRLGSVVSAWRRSGANAIDLAGLPG
jgi:hypothetical protein